MVGLEKMALARLANSTGVSLSDLIPLPCEFNSRCKRGNEDRGSNSGLYLRYTLYTVGTR